MCLKFFKGDKFDLPSVVSVGIDMSQMVSPRLGG